MEEYETLSCVCGYNEYQRVWMAEVGEELRCERERPRNPTDPYAVVVKKDGISQLAKARRKCSMLLIVHVKNFICLIFTVWLNCETFLPSKL